MIKTVFILFYLLYFNVNVILCKDYDQMDEPIFPEESFIQYIEAEPLENFEPNDKMFYRAANSQHLDIECIKKFVETLKDNVQKIQNNLNDLEQYIMNPGPAAGEMIGAVKGENDNSEGSNAPAGSITTDECDTTETTTECETTENSLIPLNVSIQTTNEISGSGSENNENCTDTGSSSSSPNAGSNSNNNGPVECETPQKLTEDNTKTLNKQINLCKELLQGNNKNLVEALSNLFPQSKRTIKIRNKKRKRLGQSNLRGSENAWTAWSNWSPCSVSCGAGKQIRYRKCIGDNCQADIEMDERQCFQPICEPEINKVFGML